MPVFDASFRSMTLISFDGAWSMGAHRHDFCELLVFEDARHTLDLDGTRYENTDGDAVLFRPDAVHTERTVGSGRSEWWCLSFVWPDGPADTAAKTHDTFGRMRQICRWLFDERDARDDGAVERRDAFLHALLSEYVASLDRPTDDLSVALRSWVHDHMDERITLDDLAADAALSKYHYCREYRKATGRTPMQDVRRIRLAFARDLVLTTDLPLKAIAPRAGLGDEHSLSRLFRKHFDATPSEMRAADADG